MRSRVHQVPQGHRAPKALQVPRESWACQVHLEWTVKRVPKEQRVTRAAWGSWGRKERQEKWAQQVPREQKGQKETKEKKETLGHHVYRIIISYLSLDPPDYLALWVLQESKGLKVWMVQREKKVTVVKRGTKVTPDLLVSRVLQGSLVYLVPKEKRESQGSQDWMVSLVSEERKEREVKEGRRVNEEYRGEKGPKDRRGNQALPDWISLVPWDQTDCQ